MTGFEDTLPQPEEILFPFQDLYPEIQDWVLDDIIQWIKDLGDRVYQWFLNLWSNIVAYLYLVRDYIISSVSSLVNNIWLNLQSQFFRISDYLSNIWYKLYNIGAEILSSVSQYVSQVVYYIQNTIIPYLQQIWTNVSQTAIQVYNAVRDNVVQFAQSVWSWIQQIVTQLQGGISWLWDHIVEWFNSIVSSIKETWGNISEWFKSAWEWITGIPEKVGNFLASELTKIFDKIYETLTKDAKEAYESIKKDALWPEKEQHTSFIEALLRPWTVIFQWGSKNFVDNFPDWTPGAALGTPAWVSTMESWADHTLGASIDGISSVFEGIGHSSPRSISEVITPIKRAMFVLLMGLIAFTVGGELIGFFKHIGLGYLAAIIYDMVNYRTLTASLMSTLALVYISTPVKYFYQELARPYYPSEANLLRLAGEYAIDKAEFKKIMGYHGYSNYWADKLYELADTPARYFALRAIADTGYWDEDFFEFELRNSGYNERTIPVLKDMLRRYSKGEAKGYGLTTVIKRYREGLIDEGQLSAELEILGIPREKHNLFRFVADLEYQYDFASDMIAAYREQLRRGMIDTGTFRQQLLSLGIRPDKVEAYVLREEARQFKPPKTKPEVAPVPFYLTDEGSVRMKAEIEAFRHGLIDAPELYARLINLQMEPSLAEAYVDYEVIKKSKPAE